MISANSYPVNVNCYYSQKITPKRAYGNNSNYLELPKQKIPEK